MTLILTLLILLSPVNSTTSSQPACNANHCVALPVVSGEECEICFIEVCSPPPHPCIEESQ